MQFSQSRTACENWLGIKSAAAACRLGAYSSRRRRYIRRGGRHNGCQVVTTELVRMEIQVLHGSQTDDQNTAAVRV
ncbi:hypothetical protein Cob_v004273 [Colletotrichum orbiculare MAFF 240422]|uniref:Uncharacterized protein n=1 Tax=Colletotrichum orbiculare (strain 104-T / ATCC 96160 / CBS 514.97 / LARS 414 / MAFF 240422) TaxID=1213857 RepID=A0A484FXC8_COLOR|nr:hypothetical protein Cob_v004273 [Colletotrichum orbiculare MAFF 240422]